MTRRQLRQAAKELAAKGGRSATGTAKRRPRAHYVRAGKLSAKARMFQRIDELQRYAEAKKKKNAKRIM